MIVEYTRSALEGLRRNMPPPPTRLGWADALAASLKVEPIRNRDRPQVEFPKGVQFRKVGRRTVAQ